MSADRGEGRSGVTEAPEHVGIARAQSEAQDKGWQEERLEQAALS